MNKYQAVIIGFGKAGKTLAVTLAKAGWRVALIEQSNAMGNDSNLLIVFYVQIMPDDFVMQLHRF
ncbi:putative pyridine nucleotide-disulfide oxidoreductase [Escherichia coli]|nr:putative pyridine nucleotide-disulfide oxidoreductase [Escherichia coli]